MFIRSNRNRSGSKSIQVVSKEGGKYRVVKSFGSSSDAEVLKALEQKAKFFIAKERKKDTHQIPLLSVEEPEDLIVREFVETIHGTHITQAGPELVLGKIFDSLGLKEIPEEMFRHMTLARLTYPVSKLKTTEYLLQHHGVEMEIDAVYRFLDRFHQKYKKAVEKVIYEHSKKIFPTS